MVFLLLHFLVFFVIFIKMNALVLAKVFRFMYVTCCRSPFLGVFVVFSFGWFCNGQKQSEGEETDFDSSS